jgi:apolipoprotein N-acyltransferase
MFTCMTAKFTYDALPRDGDALYRWAWVAFIAPIAVFSWIRVFKPRGEKALPVLAGLLFLFPAAVMTAVARARVHGNSEHFWMNCVFFGSLGIILCAIAFQERRRPADSTGPTPEP